MAADSIRIFDLHCDTLDSLSMHDVEPFSRSASNVREGDDLAHNSLQLSLERMAQAGSWCQCFAVWVPDDLSKTGLKPHEFYRKVASYFREQLEEHKPEVCQVLDGRKVKDAFSDGRVAAMLTVENASPLEYGLSILDEMRSDGVKMITLTWNGQNCIGSGNDTREGLSPFGIKALKRMEELHIVADVSHLNDAGFRDVLSHATRPFVATHSNSRSVCAHPRNLTDYEFEAIRDRGGLVGINYCRSFIADRFNQGSGKDSGQPEVTFDEMSYHIDHFLELGGEHIIALGSDFDGSTTPSWLSGAQDMPAFHALVARRFGEDIAEAMFFQNAASFFARNEED